MEPVISMVERIKSFAISTGRSFNSAIGGSSNPDPHKHNPIEILKRLQRETFCDLMKLRDRQDKVERVISLYRSAKGGPFQEATTHMKGIVDVVGATLFLGNDYEQVLDTLEKAGINMGVNLRFMLETVVRKKDIFIAEFITGKNSLANSSNLSGSPLALEKLMYVANINDHLSVVATPLGARCCEYGNGLSSAPVLQRGRVPSLVPPLFSQYHNCGVGVTVRGSDVAVSLAELVSDPGAQSDAAGTSLSTFGQVTYQPSEEFSLTLSCLWQIPSTLFYPFKLGMLVIPVGQMKRRTSADVTRGKEVDGFSSRSIALMLESEIGECNNFGGWVEIQKSRSNLLQWGVSYSDTPEDELGWGMRMAGKTERNSSQLQLEGFLNFNMGKNATLQPGILYAMDGKSQTPALVFRSCWSM